MTPDQAAELAAHLRAKREQAGVSQRHIAKVASVAQSQIVRFEQGIVLNPSPEVLAAYADTIGVPMADIFTMANLPIARGLPTLRPYLRAKYRDMSAEDTAKVEAFVDELMRQYDNGGPEPGDDEA